MAEPLEQVFTAATNEDARRAQLSKTLDAVLTGPAKDIIAAVENIKAAATAARKAIPWRHRLDDDALKLGLKYFEGPALLNADEKRLEKTYHLNQGGYGRGISLTFRDDGTMKIEQQNKSYKLVRDAVRYLDAVPTTDRKTAYDGPVDSAKAHEELGIFLSLAMPDSARQKLQTALGNITPASGNSPRPQA